MMSMVLDAFHWMNFVVDMSTKDEIPKRLWGPSSITI